VATRTTHSSAPLAEYVKKRDFAATPEPHGRKRGASKTLRFVVQKHRATRLHYDFRLEAGGVLASWAVPKGPTLVPAPERRLAMKVEDHPYDYRTFEGIIPKGNYGAGEVIVWDEGTYRLAEGTDPAAEIAAGKIKFILRGKKLRGMFTLVKIKPRAGESGDPWLLLKDHDEFDDPDYDPEAHPESARTGKTLADVKASPRAKTWKSNRLAANAKAPVPKDVAPMLSTSIDEPFDGDEWLFEVKWDGYRAIASIAADGTVTMTSRNGLDLLARFPDLSSIGAAFRSLPVLVDGEICVLDAKGHSSFGGLQSRNPGDPGLMFVAFDLLYADGKDVRELPLEERKARLEKLIVPRHGVLYSKHIVGRGREFFTAAQQAGLEGIVGKRRDAPYRSTRSRAWVKIKAQRRQEFVIGGWTEPRGSRKQFGALLLGVYENGKLVYAGHVGTGFDEKKLREIGKQLRERERATSPFLATPKTNTRAHFVHPDLVAEVSFTEWTRDRLLRHPVFLGLRIDKNAKDVGRAP